MTSKRSTITPAPIPTPITAPLSELELSSDEESLVGGVNEVDEGEVVLVCGGGGA